MRETRGCLKTGRDGDASDGSISKDDSSKLVQDHLCSKEVLNDCEDRLADTDTNESRPQGQLKCQHSNNTH